MVSGLLNNFFSKVSESVANSSLARYSLAIAVGVVAINVFNYYFSSAGSSSKSSDQPNRPSLSAAQTSHTLGARAGRFDSGALAARRARNKEYHDALRFIDIKSTCQRLQNKAESVLEYSGLMKDGVEKRKLIEATTNAIEMMKKIEGCSQIENLLPILGVNSVEEAEKNIDALLEELTKLNDKYSQLAIGVTAAVITTDLLFS